MGAQSTFELLVLLLKVIIRLGSDHPSYITIIIIITKDCNRSRERQPSHNYDGRMTRTVGGRHQTVLAHTPTQKNVGKIMLGASTCLHFSLQAYELGIFITHTVSKSKQKTGPTLSLLPSHPSLTLPPTHPSALRTLHIYRVGVCAGFLWEIGRLLSGSIAM